MATDNFDATVLIAGGGLIGLSTAMFLAQHGVRRWRSNACATSRPCLAPRIFTCARSNCSVPAASRRK